MERKIKERKRTQKKGAKIEIIDELSKTPLFIGKNN
jgi:hypothetical protein